MPFGFAPVGLAFCFFPFSVHVVTHTHGYLSAKACAGCCPGTRRRRMAGPQRPECNLISFTGPGPSFSLLIFARADAQQGAGNVGGREQPGLELAARKPRPGDVLGSEVSRRPCWGCTYARARTDSGVAWLSHLWCDTVTATHQTVARHGTRGGDVQRLRLSLRSGCCDVSRLG